MFQNWLRPVAQDKIGVPDTDHFHIGQHTDFYDAHQGFPAGATLALLGTDTRSADAVRREFYRLAHHFGSLRLLDLGNLRRGGTEFLIPLLRELTDNHIFPLIIGADTLETVAQYKAFQLSRKAINLLAVDSHVRFVMDDAQQQVFFQGQLLEDHSKNLCHLSLIGYQNHYAHPTTVADLEAHNFDCIRLGQAKADLADLEPIIRDADLACIHLSAIRTADAPGQSAVHPAGFTTEEVCQLCRYAGMSDKLKSFGLYGFNDRLDVRGQTAQLTAQMIWYFVDGFHNRKADFPASNEGLVEYVVALKHGDQLSFWKSNRSGRWWLQVPAKRGKADHRHRLIPCSYNDYKLACQNELPDRLLHAFKRFF